MLVIDKNRELELVDFYNSLTISEQNIASKILTKATEGQNVTQFDMELNDFHDKLNDQGKSCIYELSLCALGIAEIENNITAEPG